MQVHARALHASCFGPASAVHVVTVPGRVNLIGEHIDYHHLHVLPMALPRALRIAWSRSDNPRIRAVTAAGYGERQFSLSDDEAAGPPGDWGNYLLAAIRASKTRWTLQRGIDAAVASDLPPAAGLSSSSALLTGFTIALLLANGIEPDFESLMEILPEGEQFVGTRGGGMDHAAVLGARRGTALLVGFVPASARPIPLPEDWEWLVAHSLVTAEKSGALREEYNSRRMAGAAALQRLGYSSYRDALARASEDELSFQARHHLEGMEQRCFLHVVTEAARVTRAVEAIESSRLDALGALLDASHASLRDQLGVSCPALDQLVETARAAGASGARLTGAGFGGCAVILCPPGRRTAVRDRLVSEFYAGKPGFSPEAHLIDAAPAAGALALISTNAG